MSKLMQKIKKQVISNIEYYISEGMNKQAAIEKAFKDSCIDKGIQKEIISLF